MSGMTCCSTESSFLERRCSAFTLGISSLPLVSQNSSRRLSREAWEMEAPYPGIHVIDATPKTSPCPSERLTHANDQQHIKMLDRHKLKRHEVCAYRPTDQQNSTVQLRFGGSLIPVTDTQLQSPSSQTKYIRIYSLDSLGVHAVSR